MTPSPRLHALLPEEVGDGIDQSRPRCRRSSVTIELSRSTIAADGPTVPLTPGMTTSVEIRTGTRRAIDYLLSPIRETTATAGRER